MHRRKEYLVWFERIKHLSDPVLDLMEHSSIITVKLGIEDPCEKFEPCKTLLESAKKATWEYNKAHPSKH